LTVLLFLWSKPSRIIYIKRLVVPLSCIVFILCLILFSKTAIYAASKGIDLWLNTVFPSLFPFFVASEILNATGMIKAVGVFLEPIMRPLFNVPGSGSFAFFMGVTSGYPIGAKITCDLREKGLVTKTEAERLLAFTNNSGPLFIVGAVATGMYHSPSLGLFLLICHILSCITVGLLFKLYKGEKYSKKSAYSGQMLKRFKYELRASNEGKNINSGILLGDAVRNSISLILAIGGYIVLFSVIINLLLETGVIRQIACTLSVLLAPLGLNTDIISAVISGFFEITTGTSLASSVAGIPPAWQLAATSLIIGWAGLSVHSQVYSIISKTDINIKPYFLGKLIQGVLAAIYTLLGVYLLKLETLLPKSVFHTNQSANLSSVSIKWGESFLSSCTYLLCVLAAFGFLYLSAFAINKIKNHNLKMHNLF